MTLPPMARLDGLADGGVVLQQALAPGLADPKDGLLTYEPSVGAPGRGVLGPGSLSQGRGRSICGRWAFPCMSRSTPQPRAQATERSR